MSGGQQLRRVNEGGAAVELAEEPIGPNLAEVAALARERLGYAAEALDRLRSGQGQSWLTEGRQQGGQ